MRGLGDLEAAVMDRLWSAEGPVLVRDVLDDLNRDRALAYTTVMTVMDNLFKKGYLVRERDGRAYTYSPAQTREEHTAALMESALSSGGDRVAALLHFVDQIDDAEVAALQELIRTRITGDE